jgi:hypothetical protein
MPRRSAFTVILAVVLVLTTAPGPQASEQERAPSVKPQSFSVNVDGTASKEARRGT